LVDMKHYAAMCVQFSRGCPFNCDFCNITVLLGHRPRIKTVEQIIAELDSLYALGWRDQVFFVDDNFIGNKKFLKTALLPALARWQEDKRGIPFHTEASINLADDETLMGMMVEAGFDAVFIGIETPDEEGLKECNKKQNKNRDLVESIKCIQRAGLQVQAGFIVGFDHDSPTIFQRQIDFIQNSGIIVAMVGLLVAPQGTRLYHRLKRENRLISETAGDNTDFSLNFTPKMDYHVLINGYKHVLDTIYSPRHYYERVVTMLKEYKPRKTAGISHLQFCYVTGFLKSLWFLGVQYKGRRYFWRLLISTLFRHPRKLPLSVSLSVSGFHFRKVAESYDKIPLA